MGLPVIINKEDKTMAKKMHPMHKALVAKVRKVNREAANWIRDEAHKIKMFNAHTDDLKESFTWYFSPQGRNYWKDIFEKIGGKW
jgi:hypothetical protein